ncbi:MAG: hypothetical protein ABIO72_05760 [Patescibacteria group bacterium]
MSFSNKQCGHCRRAKKEAPVPLPALPVLIAYGVSIIAFVALLWILREQATGYTICAWGVFIFLQIYLFGYVGRPFLRRSVKGKTCYLFRDDTDVVHVHTFQPVFRRLDEHQLLIQFRVGGYFRTCAILPRDPGYGLVRWKIDTWDGRRFALSDQTGQRFSGIVWEDLMWLLAHSNGGTGTLMGALLQSQMGLNEKCLEDDGPIIQVDKHNQLGVEIQKALLVIHASKDGYDQLPQEVRQRLERALSTFSPSRRELWKRHARVELSKESKGTAGSPKEPPLAN